MSPAGFQTVLLLGLASYFLTANSQSVNLLGQLHLSGKILDRFLYGFYHGQGTIFP